MENRRDPFLLSQIPRYKLTIKYDKHRARRTYTIEESGNLGVTWFANKERVYDGYPLQYLFDIINKNNEK